VKEYDVKISIMLEGQHRLDWAHWQNITALADQAGFAGVFRSDHFTDPHPPNYDSLELIVSLMYAATQTKHIHFGACVAPVSFRDPILYARQAMQINQLSGGRMIFGIGAGWQEREHTMFGYPLGDTATRMARFEEALEVTTRLMRSSEPVTFQGTFYQLHEAELLPRSAVAPLVMVGGNGPKRTLPLTARYADIWNGVWLAPEEFAERNRLLDTLLDGVGRPRSAVQRTVMTGMWYGENRTQLERALQWRSSRLPVIDGSLDAKVANLREGNRQLVGTAPEIIAQLQAYAAVGVEEIFVQWLNLADLDGLRSFAAQVLPQF
jgi:alkanesulfonate monooxygenase SsuD/methylene tetrahydromethanopterin reductase-like flavin-dependent oxidoreductase (luciferase family)